MSSTARSELTPTGSMRVGINFGNTVLAARDERGAPRGIAADLADELCRRLGATREWMTYDAAGPMADGAKENAWDVAFLAADPARAQEIAFTSPYLEIDSTYLVAESSIVLTPQDIDREGVRIAVSQNSAYDLFLSRNLKHAEIVRAANPKASIDLFMENSLDALAGIRPMLHDVARILPGTRVLDGRFATVQQAIGTPRLREAAAAYLRDFVADIKASGFLKTIIEKDGVAGVALL